MATHPNLVKNHTQGFALACKCSFKDPNGNIKGCEKVDDCFAHGTFNDLIKDE